MKRSKIDKIYDFYDKNDIGNDNKRKFMRLYVNMGSIGTFCEHRFVPTGRIKVDIVVKINSISETKTIEYREMLDDVDVSTYKISKITINKLKEDGIDSNICSSLKASVYTEFDVYGYAGDVNRKYNVCEYRSLIKDLPLYNQEKLGELKSKYKEFKEFKKQFNENQKQKD